VGLEGEGRGRGSVGLRVGGGRWIGVRIIIGILEGSSLTERLFTWHISPSLRTPSTSDHGEV